MSYFIEGLLPQLKVKVLEKMPGTLFEAEEFARTLDSINRRVGLASENNQVERLINALMVNGQQVPALTAGASSQPGDKQIQFINAKLDALTNKLERVGNNATQTQPVAAYSEPKEEQMVKLMRELKEDLLNEMQQRDRRMDARINGLVRRLTPNRYDFPPQRQRTRDGRPICFDCGASGHIQFSCPYRRARPIPNALPAPGPQRRMDQRGNSYNSGYQQRQREFGPAHRQDNLAALDDTDYQWDNYDFNQGYRSDHELYHYDTNTTPAPYDYDYYGEEPVEETPSNFVPASLPLTTNENVSQDPAPEFTDNSPYDAETEL